MKKRLLAAALVALFASSSFATAAPAWEKHDYEGDNISFYTPPGEVTVKPTALDAQMAAVIDHENTYAYRADGVSYIIVATQYKPGKNAFSKEAVEQVYKANCAPETVQLGDTDGFDENGGGAFMAHGEKCLGGAKTLEGAYYEYGEWYYQVYFTVPAGNDEIYTTAGRFISQFSLLYME